MTRLCGNCGFVNQDDYDFCAKCGTPLVEGVQPRNFIVLKPEDVKINNKAIIISYIITIFLSWSGFVIGMLLKNTQAGAFAFFGFFMPFYLVQSRHPTIRKHGIIQLAISLVGVALSFYVMMH
ncbi:zinc ribbon domain-containing protein [Methanobrevibacter sp.]|uniref:zinc ribbon domain-containing protein n=1 Tax=Methanobrevibacter sp. TaxID=66852 RepID=UPI0025F3206F|nr:zinc ribbon domain-containing protein [Methanobrevibacter sp.]MBQ2665435.1 zinc ribbon domain-containing protein [Methanobrevibacter sp.]